MNALHLVTIAVLTVLVVSATNPDCASLKITDWNAAGNGTAGCRLWLEVNELVPTQGQLSVWSTLPSGSVITTTVTNSNGGYHYPFVIYETSLDNKRRVCAGSVTEAGDVSNTTLLNARFSYITLMLSANREVFYILDNGKLKKADPREDLVTHVAGRGVHANSVEEIVASIGKAEHAIINNRSVGAVSRKTGNVYIVTAVGYSMNGNLQFVALRYSPSIGIISLAVPMDIMRTLVTRQAFGAIYEAPSSLFQNDDALLIRYGRDKLAVYVPGAKNLTEWDDNAYQTFWNSAGSLGNNGMTNSEEQIFYKVDPMNSPKSPPYQLLKYDIAAKKKDLFTGIGTATGKVPTQIGGSWADLAQLNGQVSGYAFSPDGRHLWFGYTTWSGKYFSQLQLMRVEWRPHH